MHVCSCFKGDKVTKKQQQRSSTDCHFWSVLEFGTNAKFWFALAFPSPLLGFVFIYNRAPINKLKC